MESVESIQGQIYIFGLYYTNDSREQQPGFRLSCRMNILFRSFEQLGEHSKEETECMEYDSTVSWALTLHINNFEMENKSVILKGNEAFVVRALSSMHCWCRLFPNVQHTREVRYWQCFITLLNRQVSFLSSCSWYAWFIKSMVNGIYAFGFLFMTPQLFMNYKVYQLFLLVMVVGSIGLWIQKNGLIINFKNIEEYN